MFWVLKFACQWLQLAQWSSFSVSFYGSQTCSLLVKVFFFFACSHIFLTSLASSVLSCIHNSLYSVFLQYQWVQNKTPKSELLCDGLSWLRWFVCLSSLALIGSYFLIFLSFFSLIVDQQWMYNWFWWAAICTSRKKIRKCSMW